MTGLQESAGGEMAVKLDAPSPAPLAPDDRLAAVDILRGIALFGVMAINVVFEFRVSIFEQLLLPRDRSGHQSIALSATSLTKPYR
jgi:uncharacterized membrane protein YeiB